jgi:hypothetical protein
MNALVIINTVSGDVRMKTANEIKLCTKCHKAKPITEFYKNQGAHCKKCIVEEHLNWRNANPEKARQMWRNAHHRAGGKSMSESKDCAAYLGVYVAERALSKFFDNIERMPNNNPGYDFICGKGKKIDVKSACICQGISWSFTINHNQIADYFLCIAFDNRESLNPLHVWLIPGAKLKHLTALTICTGKRSIAKWSNYEQPCDKVIACCDEIRAL